MRSGRRSTLTGFSATRSVLLMLVLGLGLGVSVPAFGSQHLAVDVQDNSFQPSGTQVEVGETVTWTQSGNNPHTVTADNGSFDSHPNCAPPNNCMGTGENFSVTFQSAGEVRYHCKIHGGPGGAGMSGVVTVGEAGPAPTAPPPASTPEPTQPPAQTPDLTEAPVATPTPLPTLAPTPTEEPEEGGGLPAGAIAGLILGALAVATGAGILIYRLRRG